MPAETTTERRDATHTPGPWVSRTFRSPDGWYAAIQGSTLDHLRIATVPLGSEGVRPPEAECNAHLIAAAPAMYAAIVEAVENCEQCRTFTRASASRCARCQTFNQIIAKAEGK